MNYRVTKDLYFDDEAHVFISSRINLKVKMTPTASFLLKEFLNRPNSILTHDELIEAVWRKRGLVGSLAGLNNYISQLRKTFSFLSEGQVEILTIPRVGFKIRILNPPLSGMVESSFTNSVMKVFLVIKEFFCKIITRVRLS